MREELLGPDARLLPAEDVVRRALEAVGLDLLPVPSGDPLLAGAQALLHPDAGVIIHDAGTPPDVVWLHIAHELAHHWLHDEPAACGAADLAPDPVTDPLPYGEDYITGYSPAQRRETEANVYAAELLLPGGLLREEFVGGMTAAAIARQAGLPELAVASQLDALMSGGGTDYADAQAEEQPPADVTLDCSQRAAASVEQGPVLVTAGPGTGKTRTLVGRALHLVRNGVQADHILALTFSNRAAGEMRDRLSLVAPEAARRMWMGTFHAFGLELLRRWGTGIGLPPSPVVLDPADAVPLAERHLARLGLREYEYLSNPAYPLPGLLAAVSRAKDELVSPEDYRRLALEMADRADEEGAVRDAARALEVARFYAVWQELLAEAGMLDFGDLIYRAVGLLRDHPFILEEVRSQYRHLLVDEYQDVNRASAVLLKLLAGEGEGLWAVGDVRQAIYRFRGASPANVSLFSQDYPNGRQLPLGVNYRSREPLVGLFASTARKIGKAADGQAPDWAALRPAGESALIVAEADSDTAQADGIGAAVARFTEDGIALRDQAILCRTNAQAEALSGLLVERGVPVLYLGDLFARSEVRDMLSLLSLAGGEGRGAGLVRVACFPEYVTASADVQTALQRARDAGTSVAAALSACGVPSLMRLGNHLAPLTRSASAYLALVRYLAGPAQYLRDLLAADDPASRQRLLALHQLLTLARAFAMRPETLTDPVDGQAETVPPIRAFLSYVRRLIATGADTRARVPAGSNEVDAVRLMTIHGSKGLEFPVVFLPNLAKGLFPARGGVSLVKLPKAIDGDPSTEEGEEDARLFFVALSRARDHLVLSRPTSLRGKPADPSPLLALVEGALEAAGAQRVRWTSLPGEAAEPLAAESAPPSATLAPDSVPELEASASALEEYMACPRRYYYARVLGLRAADELTAYQAFQRCVWDTLRWVRRERWEGRSPGEDEAAARLEDRWREGGPAGHAHEPVLRARAQEMVARAVAQAPPTVTGQPAGEELAVDLPAGRVRVRADHAERTDNGALLVERYDTSQPREDDHRAPRLALMRRAARQAAAGGEDVEVRIRYLTTGEERTVPEAPRYEPARVDKYNSALASIRAGRFKADPSQECDRCPFLFICPS